MHLDEKLYGNFIKSRNRIIGNIRIVVHHSFQREFINTVLLCRTRERLLIRGQEERLIFSYAE